uniref:Arh protein n=1 Tax=Schmidtea mediterranea TaxID=79327 RepID=U5YQ69_SCHMD|nr:arh protein [Schmidtea mediterranea]
MYATKRRRRNTKCVKSLTPGKDNIKSNPSKRHRERLNSELDHLASLLPFDQSVISKLDKLSILRLAVSYLRMKCYFQTVQNDRPISDNRLPSHLYHFPYDLNCTEGDAHLQALNGFVFIVSCDGEVFSAPKTVEYYLGFHQSDILHQSVLELIHSEDREEFKRQLSWSSMLPPEKRNMSFRDIVKIENCQYLQRCFTVRFRCLLDNTSGFITLEINGRLQFLHGQPNITLEPETDKSLPPLGLFAICSPFGHLPNLDAAQRDLTFKTKHSLDLSLLAMDVRAKVTFGYCDKEISKLRTYNLVHQDDLNYLAKGHEEIFKSGTIGLLVHRWKNKSQKWVWLQSSLKIVFKAGKQHGIMATHRQLTQDEGRELYNRRNTEYKLPFPLLEPETLLEDEEEELQRSYKSNKRPRSQLKDYLQASRKRKAPYRDVLPCYSSGYSSYNPFVSLSGFGTNFANVGSSINDLGYSYQNMSTFPGFDIDLCKNYRSQYFGSSFDQYISPNPAAAAYYYGYENYPAIQNYNNSVNSDRESSGNSLIDMEVIRSQMSTYGSLADFDPSLPLAANVPKLLSPYINPNKSIIYPKYTNTDGQPFTTTDSKISQLTNHGYPASSIYLYDQPLVNFPPKDFNKNIKTEPY